MLIKRFFLSRKIILALILLMLAVVVLGYVIPQRFSTPDEDLQKWRFINMKWLSVVDSFGLDHVYTTSWFALLLFSFLLSVSFSTYEQIKIAGRKTFGKGVVKGDSTVRILATDEEVKAILEREAYLRVFSDQTVSRYIKYRWGYWGNAFFHSGFVVVILFSLIIVLTEKRGILHMVEGELYAPGSKWLYEEKGMLADALTLPGAVLLEKVSPEFWETDDLKQLNTDLIFIDSYGRIKKHGLGINDMLNFKGIRIYLTGRFGNAFLLELTDEEGKRHDEMILLPHPQKRDKAGYGNFRFKYIPYLLKAKYYADVDKKTMYANNPMLVLRLDRNGEVMGEASLSKGERGRLLSYTVKFVDVIGWEEIVFIETQGMAGIFTGFFIIIIGSSLIYFIPPRELFVLNNNDGLSVMWQASKFGTFYKDEYDRIISRLGTADKL